MKSYEEDLGQNNPRNNPPKAKTQQSNKIEDTSTASKKRRKITHQAAINYEEGDLRGIRLKAQAESIDLYHALLESCVIKNAAEFFERGNS